ncbi:MAG: alpha/beta fold hydrolase [Phycisphaerae bacterium]
MPSYAARVVSELGLDPTPCVLGGVSFGGMLACEMVARCNCRRVILIASCRSSAAIPKRNWLIFHTAKLMPDMVIRRLAGPASRVIARMEGIGRHHHRLVLDMCQDMPIVQLRRQAAMILGWRNPSRLDCPVHQIHGRRDQMIPLAGVEAEKVVADGGHFINLTHPAEVARFIVQYLEQ